MELWRLKFMSIFFAAAFMLVVAIRLNIDQMYLMSGILVSIPLVSYIVGSLALKQIAVKRSGPETCFEGDRVQVALTLEGSNELMRNLLTARDVTPDWVSVQAVVPDLDQPGHLQEEIIALRRGAYRLTSVEITASDPLGLFMFHRHVPLASDLLVYPIPVDLSEALLGREARSGREVQSTLTRRGDSPEMHSTRDYQSGDELRHIHWPSTARAGHFVVMEREEPSDRTTWIALDLRRGSEKGAPPNTSLDTATRLAAAAARDALSEGEAVALLLPGQEMSFLPPSRGPDHYYALLNHLAIARSNADLSLGESISEHVVSARSRLLFFTSSPDALLAQSIGLWIQGGGSATGILLDPETGPDSAETLALEEFAAMTESLGAVIHRVSLSQFFDTHLSQLKEGIER
jgi:uncharacterized protein (DUF58 family)